MHENAGTMCPGAHAFLVLLSTVLTAGGATKPAPTDSSVLVIAGRDEPGIRLVVTGRVLRADGRTPVPQTRVGVYHTDASGIYGVHPTRPSFPPTRDARLSGWLKTDAQGRFEIRTIRPGRYPVGKFPAHMHFIVGSRGDYELRFEDDSWSYLGASRGDEGRGVQVRPVHVDKDGVQRVTIEWRLP